MIEPWLEQLKNICMVGKREHLKDSHLQAFVSSKHSCSSVHEQIVLTIPETLNATRITLIRPMYMST